MSSSKTDRQPLLSSVHSQPHRLSNTRISFPSSSSSAFATDLSEAESTSTSVGSASGKNRNGDGHGSVGEGRVKRKEGLPKLSRECLWSEIKCYGSYILPVILVFGVLVVGASLIGVGIKKGWFK